MEIKRNQFRCNMVPINDNIVLPRGKADHIKELVLSMLIPVVFSPSQNNESSNLWNSSDTDALQFFPNTPDKFENSVTDWTFCDSTDVEAILQLQTSETSWKPTRAYTQENIIQTDEPVDESETNLKNPEGVDLNCMRNCRNQNERNTFCVKKIFNVRS